MVRLCLEKGLDVAEADAYALPFGNGSFEVVYCSFLMLWLEDPVKAVKEMARVSRGWVICLAEPDYGARIDHPPELESAGRALVRDLESLGADPFVGRKLRAIFSEAGLAAEIGVHQGVWPIEKARDEYLRQEGTVGGTPKETVEAAFGQGSLLQYNPVFYALAKK
jgi:SAM-dependent methyltransferase